MAELDTFLSKEAFGHMTNEKVFQAIQEATSAVFSTMLNLEPLPGEPRQETDPPPLNGVMALLGFTGQWVGTGMFYCQEKLACRLSSLMLMSEISDITTDVLDGVGELANMIMGNMKDQLEPVMGDLAMSIPTVVYGRNFRTRTTALRNWLVAPFSLDGDSFEIHLCFTQRQAAART